VEGGTGEVAALDRVLRWHPCDVTGAPAGSSHDLWFGGGR
jgi:hypothetical protein